MWCNAAQRDAAEAEGVATSLPPQKISEMFQLACDTTEPAIHRKGIELWVVRSGGMRSGVTVNEAQRARTNNFHTTRVSSRCPMALPDVRVNNIS